MPATAISEKIKTGVGNLSRLKRFEQEWNNGKDSMCQELENVLQGQQQQTIDLHRQSDSKLDEDTERTHAI